MKKLVSTLMVLMISLFIAGCAASNNTAQPANIDKNNVGITSGEEPDQTDPTLIEGNLEKNDFKN